MVDELARAKQDQLGLIRAWSEIGRLMGFYAPKRKAVEVSVSAKRSIDHLEAMSGEKLLAMAERALVKVN